MNIDKITKVDFRILLTYEELVEVTSRIKSNKLLRIKIIKK